MSFHADALLAVACLAAAAVVATAWRNRPSPGARPLAGLMASVGLWAGVHLVEHRAPEAFDPVIGRLEWTVLLPSAFLWFAFVLEYTGRERYLSGRGLAALFGPPAALAALVWVPDGAIPVVDVWAALDGETGPTFWGYVALSYGLLAVGSWLLVGRLVSLPALFRRQGLAILAGLAAAWGASVVSVFELFGGLHVHAQPLGIALMGAFLLWAAVADDLTDVAPIARRTVVRTLSGGVLALDADGSLVGTPVAAAGSPAPDDWLRDLATVTERLSGTVRVADRILEYDLAPLRDARERLVGRVVLLHDITDERRRQARLERQNERLDEFASIVSHDLRNPLNVASGRVSLAREACECGRGHDHLAAAARAHDRMDALIEDLLDLAREGERSIDPAPVDLSAVVDECWAAVTSDGVRLGNVADVPVVADRRGLKRLLENLLRNAVEHGSTSSRSGTDDAVEHGSTSPDSGARRDAVEHGSTSSRPGADDAAEHGSTSSQPGADDVAEGGSASPGAAVTVTVGALADGDGFYVADDGPGIPADERDRIFESGYSTAAAGTGFGLRVVAEIADAHGWDVRVVESEVGGARFEITGVGSP